jgi:putative membrane protein
MLFLIALNAAVLLVLYTVVDTDALLRTEHGNNLLRIGVLLFVLQLLVFIGWCSILINGWATSIAAFILTFLIAFTAEALGVNTGIIFGNYYYPDILGPQVFGVPVLVALAWEPILFASFYMTDILVPVNERNNGFWKRMLIWLGLAVIGAVATTAWDMMMDPFAVSKGWWVWRDGGPYTPYIESGVPVSNFVGWFITAFVCQLVCRFIKIRGPRTRHSRYLTLYGPVGLYFLLFLMLFSVSVIILKRPEVAMIGAMCMGPFLVVGLLRILNMHDNILKGLAATDEKGVIPDMSVRESG